MKEKPKKRIIKQHSFIDGWYEIEYYPAKEMDKWWAEVEEVIDKRIQHFREWRNSGRVGNNEIEYTKVNTSIRILNELKQELLISDNKNDWFVFNDYWRMGFGTW